MDYKVIPGSAALNNRAAEGIAKALAFGYPMGRRFEYMMDQFSSLNSMYEDVNDYGFSVDHDSLMKVLRNFWIRVLKTMPTLADFKIAELELDSPDAFNIIEYKAVWNIPHRTPENKWAETYKIISANPNMFELFDSSMVAHFKFAGEVICNIQITTSENDLPAAFDIDNF